ncbi:hypothetical protein AQAU111925_10590 [Aquirufa aurantiipilula]
MVTVAPTMAALLEFLAVMVNVDVVVLLATTPVDGLAVMVELPVVGVFVTAKLSNVVPTGPLLPLICDVEV